MLEERLTIEELKIMNMIINGLKYNQISENMNISKNKITKLMKSVIYKFNANNRLHAVCLLASEQVKNGKLIEIKF